MGKHVVVNRLEIPHLTRDAYNSTLRCQASNTKLAPPVERIVRLDMLRKYSTHTHTILQELQYYRIFSSFKWNWTESFVEGDGSFFKSPLWDQEKTHRHSYVQLKSIVDADSIHLQDIVTNLCLAIRSTNCYPSWHRWSSTVSHVNLRCWTGRTKTRAI